MITRRQARSLPALLNRMGAKVLGRRAIYHEEIKSTQDALMQQAGHAPDGTIILTGRQLAGRGRMGRVWTSPPGTLTFSVLLRPDIPPDASGAMMLAAAVSLYDTMQEYVPHIMLKWPNDITTHNGKLAGIVLDSAVSDVLEWIIVGVGVNISNDPHQVASRLKSDKSFGGADSVVRYAPDTSAMGILTGFLVRLDSHYASMDIENIASAYQNRCHDMGRHVHRGDIAGRAHMVEPGGALVVETDTGLQRVFF